jgi:hypothetical protein
LLSQFDFRRIDGDYKPSLSRSTLALSSSDVRDGCKRRRVR